MRNSVAKRIRKDVYTAMQYDAATDYKTVRETPKFKGIYRLRKKNYMRGIVGVSSKPIKHATS